MNFNTSSVHATLSSMAMVSGNGPPFLVGFEASRHLSRAGFVDINPTTVDMPICEETMVGAAIGLALAGQDVVVDLMFEGFLSRCLEPILIGWPTALAVAQVEVGRLVIRVLGSPVELGGPSHSAHVLGQLGGVRHVHVLYATCAEDVTWALVAFEKKRLLIVVDPPRPHLVRGDLLVIPGSPPMRYWRRGSRTLTVCSHAELEVIVATIDAGRKDSDVLSTPSGTVGPEMIKDLPRYDCVEFHGANIASS
jgi:hypothetical protein